MLTYSLVYIKAKQTHLRKKKPKYEKKQKHSTFFIFLFCNKNHTHTHTEFNRIRFLCYLIQNLKRFLGLSLIAIT